MLWFVAAVCHIGMMFFLLTTELTRFKYIVILSLRYVAENQTCEYHILDNNVDYTM